MILVSMYVYLVDTYLADVQLTVNTVSTPCLLYNKPSSSPAKVPCLAGASKSIGTSNLKSSKLPASLGGQDDGKFFLGSKFQFDLLGLAVPIYNVRKHTLSFPESLKNIDKSLP
jgi:hypothetical protein